MDRPCFDAGYDNITNCDECEKDRCIHKEHGGIWDSCTSGGRSIYRELYFHSQVHADSLEAEVARLTKERDEYAKKKVREFAERLAKEAEEQLCDGYAVARRIRALAEKEER